MRLSVLPDIEAHYHLSLISAIPLSDKRTLSDSDCVLLPNELV